MSISYLVAMAISMALFSRLYQDRLPVVSLVMAISFPFMFFLLLFAVDAPVIVTGLETMVGTVAYDMLRSALTTPVLFGTISIPTILIAVITIVLFSLVVSSLAIVRVVKEHAASTQKRAYVPRRRKVVFVCHKANFIPRKAYIRLCVMRN